MRLSRDHIVMELLACLEEQFYWGELNRAGLILLGLWELEGNNIDRIADECVLDEESVAK